MRIYKKKYYLMDHMVSTNMNFVQHNPFIVSGRKAQHNKAYVLSEYTPTGQGMFKCADGHGPDHQPIMTEPSALKWLDVNYTAFITPVEQSQARTL